MVRDSSRQIAHGVRGTRPDNPQMPWTPPLIGFCKIPAGGIAALSGTNPPSHEECDIWWGAAPDETTLDRALEDSDSKEEIYNVGTAAAAEDVIYPFWKSNCGMLFIAPQASTSTPGSFKGKEFSASLANQPSGCSNIDFTAEWPATSVYTHPQWYLSSGKLYANTAGYYFFAFFCRITVDSGDSAGLSADTHFGTGIGTSSMTHYPYCNVWVPSGDIRYSGGQDNIDLSCSGIVQVTDTSKACITYMHRHGDTTLYLDYAWRVFLSELMY